VVCQRVSFAIALLNCRTRENDFPLIAVPRLVLEYFERKRSSARRSSQPSNAKFPHATRVSNVSESHLEEMKRLNGLCLLDFPPERVASSIVHLWTDLASEESRQDFLRFLKGWIPHVVLLGCLNSKGSKFIERMIEVACCLDLLCQQHLLAIAAVHSLNKEAVSRLSVWKDVQPALIVKMDEILEGSLARDAQPTAIFRPPREISLEYWISTRAYLNDEQLFEESCMLQPPNQAVDVESRISNLEALLVTLNDISQPSLHEVEVLSDADNSSDEESDSSILCLSDEENDYNDGVDPLANAALETRQRILQRLDELKNSIHVKVGKVSRPPASLSILPLSSEKSNDLAQCNGNHERLGLSGS
jgi:hypothetical protein